MKVFDRHHFAALCKLQLKEITIWDWIMPFFAMFLLLYWFALSFLLDAIMAAGTSFVITAANTTWGQGKTVFFGVIAFAAFFAVIYILPEAALPFTFTVGAVILLIADYFIFRQTIMNIKEVI